MKEDGGKDRISDQSSFEKVKIESLGLFIFTKLTTQSHCSVSIVKRGHLLLSIFGFQKKKREKIYIYIYIKKYSEEIQKIIGARKGCWNAGKRSKLIEEVQKCKRVKFDSIFLTDKSHVDKENSI